MQRNQRTMYEFIKGNVAELTPTYAVIETAGGVGYYLNISLQTFSSIGESAQAQLYTHFVVREDVQVLYGFFDRTERELFRLLIGVSGVGGNTARMILSSFHSEELRVIIATGKADVLKSVKGLGIKTAQKIIVELKDKVGAIGNNDAAMSVLGREVNPEIFDEALSAMMMLGFAKAASEKVLRQVIKESPAASVEEIIRMTLKKM